MAKTPNVFPIVGGRKVEHLKDNIQALSIKLTTEQIKKLEDASPWTPGFPQNVSNGRYSGKLVADYACVVHRRRSGCCGYPERRHAAQGRVADGVCAEAAGDWA
jgi:hypothetical protein